MIQASIWGTISTEVGRAWKYAGPLVGVLIGGWITSRNQRKQWLRDTRKQEYRELLGALAIGYHAEVDLHTPMVARPGARSNDSAALRRTFTGHSAIGFMDDVDGMSRPACLQRVRSRYFLWERRQNSEQPTFDDCPDRPHRPSRQFMPYIKGRYGLPVLRISRVHEWALASGSAFQEWPSEIPSSHIRLDRPRSPSLPVQTRRSTP
jgi:hypothetical protein